MREFLGYFAGWPGTWEKLRGKTLVGLPILLALWVSFCLAKSYMLLAWGSIGEEITGFSVLEAFSYALQMLRVGATDFLAFVGLVAFGALALGKARWNSETQDRFGQALGAATWAWIILVPGEMLQVILAVSTVQATGAWIFPDNAALWIRMLGVNPVVTWYNTISLPAAWAMLIFGGFASRIWGKRWGVGMLVGLGAWLAWSIIRFLIFLPFLYG